MPHGFEPANAVSFFYCFQVCILKAFSLLLRISLSVVPHLFFFEKRNIQSMLFSRLKIGLELRSFFWRNNIKRNSLLINRTERLFFVMWNGMSWIAGIVLITYLSAFSETLQELECKACLRRQCDSEPSRKENEQI